MVRRMFVLVFLAHALALVLAAQGPSPAIPRTWDDEAVAALEVPLANPEFSPKHVSSDYYYRLRVRPIYKAYPVYAPDKEPPGYVEWLAKQEPEIVFDAAKLHTEADWIRAGELVFDAPTIFAPVDASPARFPEFYERSGVRLAANGTLPNKSYVIRAKGIVEVGNFSCGQCHTRVMPDGAVVKGAQGNFAEGYFFAARPRGALRNGRRDPEDILSTQRSALRRLYAVPWIQSPPEGDLSLEQILSAFEAMPPGVGIRQGTSLRYPAQIPDLIGIKDRRYLDHTGLVRHRSIGDLMRYAALNQGLDQLARYGDFVPAGDVPDPATSRSPAAWRYSDEQLYALAKYLYSLKPPPNPNKFDALAAHGKEVFTRDGCVSCHTPPLYTNNKLTPVDGFEIPKEHFGRFDIKRGSVGTDPTSALKTRRGTGYYKVPSLKGVWYRGPFEHNGSVATLEDWFDPKRLNDDYVPTGHIGYGFKTRAVKGHEFGLDLPADDKKALIAFLKTL